MTSFSTDCIAEQELIELVDGELSDDREVAVADHLAECEECCATLARHEAALRYALEGLSETGRWPGAAPTPVRRFRPRLLAAAAVLVAATLGAVGTFSGQDEPQSDAGAPAATTAAVPRTPLDEVRELRAAAEELRDHRRSHADDSRETLAMAALAAAETRVTVLGDRRAAPRFKELAERFDGTVAANEARVRYAVLLKSGDQR